MADSTTRDHRSDLRINMRETVTVRFDGATVLGSGQNISAQGVFFVAEVAIPVTVQIEGVEHAVRGELVRVQSMGDGRTGIAVRFLAPTGAPPAT
jgi:hypothetical protein